MKVGLNILMIWTSIILFSCLPPEQKSSSTPGTDSIVSLNSEEEVLHQTDSAQFEIQKEDSAQKIPGTIKTGNTRPADVVAFAKTLIGVPYKWASVNPAEGFDCSGFITYVFSHFNIPVPRSSVDFTNVGREVDSSEARPGDLVLFTGTDSTIRIVGHMGIVISNRDGDLEFIHSSSGKANGVVITPLQRSYKSRFEKVIRVFPDRLF